MLILSKKARPIQNLGLASRTTRFLLGWAILGYTVFYHGMNNPGLDLIWEVASVVLSLYLVFTAMLGWDPYNALFNIKNCNSTGRNQCGSLGYEIRAAMGHAPKYDESDAERSLETCHDEPQEKPHHQVWKVDKEPMLYPDDATLDEYARTHPEVVEQAARRHQFNLFRHPR